jgi:hypothetical protein
LPFLSLSRFSHMAIGHETPLIFALFLIHLGFLPTLGVHYPPSSYLFFFSFYGRALVHGTIDTAPLPCQTSGPHPFFFFFVWAILDPLLPSPLGPRPSPVTPNPPKPFVAREERQRGRPTPRSLPCRLDALPCPLGNPPC